MGDWWGGRGAAGCAGVTGRPCLTAHHRSRLAAGSAGLVALVVFVLGRRCCKPHAPSSREGACTGACCFGVCLLTCMPAVLSLCLCLQPRLG